MASSAVQLDRITSDARAVPADFIVLIMVVSVMSFFVGDPV
jgi:hypothetical protein